MKIVASLLNLLIAASLLLPWSAGAEGTVQTGMYFYEGLIAGILGLLLPAWLLISRLGKKTVPSWAILLSSILSLVPILLFLLRLTGWWQTTPVASLRLSDTYGLFLALLAAILLLITGLIVSRKANAFSVRQTGTAHFIANRVALHRTEGTVNRASFSRFIIRISIVATVISVMVMIVTLSLANGFQETVSRKVFSFLGHVRVQEKQPEKSIISEETTIEKNDSLAETIRRHPLVESVHPFATRYALLKTREDMEGVMIKGVDSLFDFKRFGQFIKEGRAPSFSDSVFGREIMLSDFTARQLKLKLNDRILIYFIKAGAGEDGGGMPDIRPYKLTITGIYKTGIEEYDRTFALADLRLRQRQNIDSAGDESYKNMIGGYEVFLKDYRDIDKAVEELYALPDFPLTWDTVSVRSISPNIFDWLNMQDVTRNVLIAFMVIVAVINLITCLLILVLERVRMIGILKALGATDGTIQKIFLRHSLIITVTGVVAGTALALLLLWLQQAPGFIRLPEDAYYVNKAAVKIVWWQVAAIGFFTMLICFLVLTIPSLLARRVRPVNAIRFR